MKIVSVFVILIMTIGSMPIIEISGANISPRTYTEYTVVLDAGVDMIDGVERNLGYFNDSSSHTYVLGKIKEGGSLSSITPISTEYNRWGGYFAGWSFVSGHGDSEGKESPDNPYNSSIQSVLYQEKDSIDYTDTLAEQADDTGTITLYAVWAVEYELWPSVTNCNTETILKDSDGNTLKGSPEDYNLKVSCISVSSTVSASFSNADITIKILPLGQISSEVKEIQCTVTLYGLKIYSMRIMLGSSDNLLPSDYTYYDTSVFDLDSSSGLDSGFNSEIAIGYGLVSFNADVHVKNITNLSSINYLLEYYYLQERIDGSEVLPYLVIKAHTGSTIVDLGKDGVGAYSKRSKTSPTEGYYYAFPEYIRYFGKNSPDNIRIPSMSIYGAEPTSLVTIAGMIYQCASLLMDDIIFTNYTSTKVENNHTLYANGFDLYIGEGFAFSSSAVTNTSSSNLVYPPSTTLSVPTGVGDRGNEVSTPKDFICGGTVVKNNEDAANDHFPVLCSSDGYHVVKETSDYKASSAISGQSSNVLVIRGGEWCRIVADSRTGNGGVSTAGLLKTDGTALSGKSVSDLTGSTISLSAELWPLTGSEALRPFNSHMILGGIMRCALACGGQVEANYVGTSLIEVQEEAQIFKIMGGSLGFNDGYRTNTFVFIDVNINIRGGTVYTVAGGSGGRSASTINQFGNVTINVYGGSVGKDWDASDWYNKGTVMTEYYTIEYPTIQDEYNSISCGAIYGGSLAGTLTGCTEMLLEFLHTIYFDEVLSGTSKWQNLSDKPEWKDKTAWGLLDFEGINDTINGRLESEIQINLLGGEIYRDVFGAGKGDSGSSGFAQSASIYRSINKGTSTNDISTILMLTPSVGYTRGNINIDVRDSNFYGASIYGGGEGYLYKDLSYCVAEYNLLELLISYQNSVRGSSIAGLDGDVTIDYNCKNQNGPVSIYGGGKGIDPSTYYSGEFTDLDKYISSIASVNGNISINLNTDYSGTVFGGGAYSTVGRNVSGWFSIGRDNSKKTEKESWNTTGYKCRWHYDIQTGWNLNVYDYTSTKGWYLLEDKSIKNVQDGSTLVLDGITYNISVKGSTMTVSDVEVDASNSISIKSDGVVIHGEIFGGGEGDDSDPYFGSFAGVISIIMDKTSFEGVLYGGGSLSETIGTVNLDISNSDFENSSIFGGGRGSLDSVSYGSVTGPINLNIKDTTLTDTETIELPSGSGNEYILVNEKGVLKITNVETSEAVSLDAHDFSGTINVSGINYPYVYNAILNTITLNGESIHDGSLITLQGQTYTVSFQDRSLELYQTVDTSSVGIQTPTTQKEFTINGTKEKLWYSVITVKDVKFTFYTRDNTNPTWLWITSWDPVTTTDIEFEGDIYHIVVDGPSLSAYCTYRDLVGSADLSSFTTTLDGVEYVYSYSVEEGWVFDGVLVDSAVYGGGALSKTDGDVTIVISGSNLDSEVYGGGKGVSLSKDPGNVKGDIDISVSDSHITKSLYGGGSLSETIGDIDMEITDSIIDAEVFGGGKGDLKSLDLGHIAGNIDVTVDNCTISEDLFGGGALSVTDGDVELTVGNSTVNSNVYGGGKGDLTSPDFGSINGDIKVYAHNSEITEDLFGGGALSKTVGNVSVIVDLCMVYEPDGTVVWYASNFDPVNIFGGGMGSDEDAWYGSVIGDIDLGVYNCEIWGSVYGGGSLSVTDGVTNVLFKDSKVADTVYGGGYGIPGRVSVTKLCTVDLEGNAIILHDVYGGAAYGIVKDTYVEVSMNSTEGFMEIDGHRYFYDYDVINGWEISSESVVPISNGSTINLGGITYNVTIQNGVVLLEDTSGNLVAKIGVNSNTCTVIHDGNLVYGTVTINGVDYPYLYKVIGGWMIDDHPGNKINLVALKDGSKVNLDGRTYKVHISDYLELESTSGTKSKAEIGYVKYSVYGGGLGTTGVQSTSGNRVVYLIGGSINGNIYGGSCNGSDFREYVSVHVTEHYTSFRDLTTGELPGSDSLIVIKDGKLYGSVFGGGYQSITNGDSHVFVGYTLDSAGTVQELLTKDDPFITYYVNKPIEESDIRIHIKGSVYGGCDVKATDSGVSFSRYLLKGGAAVLIYDPSNRNVEGVSNKVVIDGSVFGSGNSCLNNGNAYIEIEGLGTPGRTVESNAIHRADYVNIHYSFIDLEGRVVSLEDGTLLTLYDIGTLNLIEGTILYLHNSASGIIAYNSLNKDMNPTTEGSPENTIYLNNGCSFNVKGVDWKYSTTGTLLVDGKTHDYLYDPVKGWKIDGEIVSDGSTVTLDGKQYYVDINGSILDLKESSTSTESASEVNANSMKVMLGGKEYLLSYSTDSGKWSIGTEEVRDDGTVILDGEEYQVFIGYRHICTKEHCPYCQEGYFYEHVENHPNDILSIQCPDGSYVYLDSHMISGSFMFEGVKQEILYNNLFDIWFLNGKSVENGDIVTLEGVDCLVSIVDGLFELIPSGSSEPIVSQIESSGTTTHYPSELDEHGYGLVTGYTKLKMASTETLYGAYVNGSLDSVGGFLMYNGTEYVETFQDTPAYMLWYLYGMETIQTSIVFNGNAELLEGTISITLPNFGNDVLVYGGYSPNFADSNMVLVKDVKDVGDKSMIVVLGASGDVLYGTEGLYLLTSQAPFGSPVVFRLNGDSQSPTLDITSVIKNPNANISLGSFTFIIDLCSDTEYVENGEIKHAYIVDRAIKVVVDLSNRNKNADITGDIFTSVDETSHLLLDPLYTDVVIPNGFIGQAFTINDFHLEGTDDNYDYIIHLEPISNSDSTDGWKEKLSTADYTLSSGSFSDVYMGVLSGGYVASVGLTLSLVDKSTGEVVTLTDANKRGLIENLKIIMDTTIGDEEKLIEVYGHVNDPVRVTYLYNDHNHVSSQSVLYYRYGSVITNSDAISSLIDYFVYWKDVNTGFEFDMGTILTKPSYTLEAVCMYTVTLDLKDGTTRTYYVAVDDPSKSIPMDIIRYGYSLDGWEYNGSAVEYTNGIVIDGQTQSVISDEKVAVMVLTGTSGSFIINGVTYTYTYDDSGWRIGESAVSSGDTVSLEIQYEVIVEGTKVSITRPGPTSTHIVTLDSESGTFALDGMTYYYTYREKVWTISETEDGPNRISGDKVTLNGIEYGFSSDGSKVTLTSASRDLSSREGVVNLNGTEYDYRYGPSPTDPSTNVWVIINPETSVETVLYNGDVSIDGVEYRCTVDNNHMSLELKLSEVKASIYLDTLTINGIDVPCVYDSEKQTWTLDGKYVYSESTGWVVDGVETHSNTMLMPLHGLTCRVTVGDSDVTNLTAVVYAGVEANANSIVLNGIRYTCRYDPDTGKWILYDPIPTYDSNGVCVWSHREYTYDPVSGKWSLDGEDVGDLLVMNGYSYSVTVNGDVLTFTQLTDFDAYSGTVTLNGFDAYAANKVSSTGDLKQNILSFDYTYSYDPVSKKWIIGGVTFGPDSTSTATFDMDFTAYLNSSGNLVLYKDSKVLHVVADETIDAVWSGVSVEVQLYYEYTDDEGVIHVDHVRDYMAEFGKTFGGKTGYELQISQALIEEILGDDKQFIRWVCNVNGKYVPIYDSMYVSAVYTHYDVTDDKYVSKLYAVTADIALAVELYKAFIDDSTEVLDPPTWSLAFTEDSITSTEGWVMFEVNLNDAKYPGNALKGWVVTPTSVAVIDGSFTGKITIDGVSYDCTYSDGKWTLAGVGGFEGQLGKCTSYTVELSGKTHTVCVENYIENTKDGDVEKSRIFVPTATSELLTQGSTVYVYVYYEKTDKTYIVKKTVLSLSKDAIKTDEEGHRVLSPAEYTFVYDVGTDKVMSDKDAPYTVYFRPVWNQELYEVTVVTPYGGYIILDVYEAGADPTVDDPLYSKTTMGSGESISVWVPYNTVVTLRYNDGGDGYQYVSWERVLAHKSVRFVMTDIETQFESNRKYLTVTHDVAYGAVLNVNQIILDVVYSNGVADKDEDAPGLTLTWGTNAAELVFVGWNTLYDVAVSPEFNNYHLVTIDGYLYIYDAVGKRLGEVLEGYVVHDLTKPTEKTKVQTIRWIDLEEGAMFESNYREDTVYTVHLVGGSFQLIRDITVFNPTIDNTTRLFTIDNYLYSTDGIRIGELSKDGVRWVSPTDGKFILGDGWVFSKDDPLSKEYPEYTVVAGDDLSFTRNYDYAKYRLTLFATGRHEIYLTSDYSVVQEHYALESMYVSKTTEYRLSLIPVYYECFDDSYTGTFRGPEYVSSGLVYTADGSVNVYEVYSATVEGANLFSRDGGNTFLALLPTYVDLDEAVDTGKDVVLWGHLCRIYRGTMDGKVVEAYSVDGGITFIYPVESELTDVTVTVDLQTDVSMGGNTYHMYYGNATGIYVFSKDGGKSFVNLDGTPYSNRISNVIDLHRTLDLDVNASSNPYLYFSRGSNFESPLYSDPNSAAMTFGNVTTGEAYTTVVYRLGSGLGWTYVDGYQPLNNYKEIIVRGLVTFGYVVVVDNFLVDTFPLHSMPESDILKLDDEHDTRLKVSQSQYSQSYWVASLNGSRYTSVDTYADLVSGLSWLGELTYSGFTVAVNDPSDVFVDEGNRIIYVVFKWDNYKHWSKVHMNVEAEHAD